VLNNFNGILVWSLLAVQQPFWSVLEMIARTLIKAGTVLIACGVATETTNLSRSNNNNTCSCVCLCVGCLIVPPAQFMKRLSQKLSIYCSKFYISMLAYDVELGGDKNNFWALATRLKRYGDESEIGVHSLLFYANKSIASSNNANFCILLGCLSSLIAAVIDEQAALYGYLAGYLACSTLLEVQSSMFHWFLLVVGSQDVEVCPEVRDPARHPGHCLLCRHDCLSSQPACSCHGADNESSSPDARKHQRRPPKSGAAGKYQRRPR